VKATSENASAASVEVMLNVRRFGSSVRKNFRRAGRLKKELPDFHASSRARYRRP
jgi:hypothetical protein